MSQTKKRVIAVIISTLMLAGLGFVYHAEWTYRFLTISKDKVYKSAAIPLDKLPSYLDRYNIKTVIDLREGSIIDPLNPAFTNDVIKEEALVKSMDGISYINIPSSQIPSKENLEDFYKVLDNPINYPVLIHCHHGTGRAAIYSALYRIEYENHSPDLARRKTRLLTKFSSFDDGSPKGEWLKQYKPRRISEASFVTENTSL